MTLALVSILLGAFSANLLGVFWYMALAKPWQAASKVSQADIEGTPGFLMFLYPFAAWIIASIGFALMVNLTGLTELTELIQLAVFAWIAGVFPATMLAVFFGVRGWNLLWIDGGYVLAGLVIIGAVQALL